MLRSNLIVVLRRASGNPKPSNGFTHKEQQLVIDAGSILLYGGGNLCLWSRGRIAPPLLYIVCRVDPFVFPYVLVKERVRQQVQFSGSTCF